MGIYKHVRESWNAHFDKKCSDELKKVWQDRLVQWRKEPVTIRVERPTRLDRARSVGYRAKQGIIVVRQRVSRGGRQRPKIKGGRRSKHNRQRKVLNISYQVVAEQRTSKKFPNCEVLNSYYVAEDGLHYWYEIILVDRDHPAILADPQLCWITQPEHHGRAFRGLTSAARASRGLLNKGKGAEKLRPSLRAHLRLGK